MQGLIAFTFKEQKDRERLREGLRRAGMPPGREPVAAAEDLIYQTEEGPEVKGATTVDVAAAKALFDRGVPFVDVRGDSYWAEGHIPGAVQLHHAMVFSKIELSRIVRKNDEVVLYCGGPT